MENELFYPPLKRRNGYRRTIRGTYYADYSEYRQEIREDCLKRCVYCDSHENEIGGQENMQLDHFRPKRYKEFKELASDPNNLVWACAGCNRLKSDHWPALGTEETYVGEVGFVDPFEEPCREYFEVGDSGKIRPVKPPAAYIIRLLALNRISRTRVRQIRLKRVYIDAELERLISELDDMIESLKSDSRAEYGEALPDFLITHVHRLRDFRDRWKVRLEGRRP